MLNLSIKRSFSSQRSGENKPRHVRNNLSSSSDEPKKASTLKAHGDSDWRWHEGENPGGFPQCDEASSPKALRVFLGVDWVRKHHNEALIAFQASAFSSIELDYLCAGVLQSSSTTWGLHINPSVLMALRRRREHRLPALQTCADRYIV